jgi:hypothetical protein
VSRSGQASTCKLLPIWALSPAASILSASRAEPAFDEELKVLQCRGTGWLAFNLGHCLDDLGGEANVTLSCKRTYDRRVTCLPSGGLAACGLNYSKSLVCRHTKSCGILARAKVCLKISRRSPVLLGRGEKKCYLVTCCVSRGGKGVHPF